MPLGVRYGVRCNDITSTFLFWYISDTFKSHQFICLV